MMLAPGVELAGYLGSAVGVGEAARRYAVALRSVGVPLRERDIPLEGRDPIVAATPSGPTPPVDEVRFNLLCLNPEQMVPYLASADSPPTARRETIAIWSWEVDVLPPGWRSAATGLAELWTYSQFAAERMEAALDLPVIGIPPPVSLPAPGTLPDELPGGFRFLVMFDYLSTLERKNPLAAVAAFRAAFEPRDGSVLIVKSVNARHRQERHAEVTEAIGDRPDIVQIDRTMTRPERDRLIADCDCLLSLHRSEGHGMPLAEAMAAGKPVVATAYGGNVEFMNERNSYPVAWIPVQVGPEVEHYPAGATWAEPNVEHAVRLLRTVREQADDAARRATRGRHDVSTQLAPEAVGARIVERLIQLRAARVRRTRNPLRRLARRR